MRESIHRKRKKLLYKLKLYAKRAHTRKGAYALISRNTGRTVNSLRVAASREGLTSRRHSLQFAFSEKEEEALVTACIVHARQGTPLTIRDFIQMASFFAPKKKDSFLPLTPLYI